MEIRTYTGRTLVEALGLVKQELGEEAVILTSRRAEDPTRLPEGHQVEVVAALPAPLAGRRTGRGGEPRAWQPPRLRRDGSMAPAAAEPPPAFAPTPPLASAKAPAPAVPFTIPATGPGTLEPDLRELRGELQDLRRALRDLGRQARHGGQRAWSAAHEESLRRLCGRGLSRAAACALLDELEETADPVRWEKSLAGALARRLPCARLDAVEAESGRRVEVLVGPTGVGKTTALAKLLLHREGLPHRRAGILSLDTKRVAAVDQIRRLAGILRTPLELLYRPGDLGAALERLSGCDLVLVDTPGTGPRERLGLERTRAFLRELRPRHVHVVLPASMRLEDQLAALAPWRQNGADRLLITKLDEATGLGGLVDLAEQAGLPFGHAATGQRIPDDLVRAAPELLAHWILNPDALGRDEGRAEGLRRLKALVAEARAES